MAQNYFQKEIETMPVEEIKKLQSEKLVKQVKHVYDNVKYYRDLMDEKGVKPEDIKDDTNIAEELGADSLDLVEILMSLEDEFGVSIPDEAIPEIKTIKHIVDFIESHKK